MLVVGDGDASTDTEAIDWTGERRPRECVTSKRRSQRCGIDSPDYRPHDGHGVRNASRSHALIERSRKRSAGHQPERYRPG